MLKKRLLMVLALGTTLGIANAIPQYSSSKCSKKVHSSFIQGWFVGLNPGYQQNWMNISGLGHSYKFNSPSLGIHLDYNHLISNPLFLGAGLDTNYGLKSSKLPAITLRKELSTALTVRFGMISGPYAFDINGAVLVTDFYAKDNRVKESIRQTLIGVAPGVGITFSAAKNISTGINYRYEVYPKRSFMSHPRITSHNIFAKVSYSLSN